MPGTTSILRVVKRLPDTLTPSTEEIVGATVGRGWATGYARGRVFIHRALITTVTSFARA